jgi:hypothetical protein
LATCRRFLSAAGGVDGYGKPERQSYSATVCSGYYYFSVTLNVPKRCSLLIFDFGWGKLL